MKELLPELHFSPQLLTESSSLLGTSEEAPFPLWPLVLAHSVVTIANPPLNPPERLCCAPLSSSHKWGAPFSYHTPEWPERAPPAVSHGSGLSQCQVVNCIKALMWTVQCHYVPSLGVRISGELCSGARSQFTSKQGTCKCCNPALQQTYIN